MSIVKIREYRKLPRKGETTSEEKESMKILENLELVEADAKLLTKLQEGKILFTNYVGFGKKLSIQADSSIGIAKFTNFSVHIGPKFVNIKKIVKLIEYVNNLDLKIFPESETTFTDENDLLSEIIIASFLYDVQVLLNQGMVKSYNAQEDNLHALRGKLLLSQQFKNDFSGKLQFACEYDELEYNNLENQIIRYCLETCSKVTINKDRKQKINQLIQTISEHVEYKQISESDFGKINYSQNNHHYKKIHDNCKLIINSIRISDFYNQTSEKSIYSFFVNMNNIFERFVFKLFKEALPHRCIKKSSEGFNSEISPSRNIDPDIQIKDISRKKLEMILDTKYKDGSIKREDLYQLSSYATIKQKNDVYAILPETPDSKIDDWKMKNSDIIVHVRYINIDDALDMIASTNIKDRKSTIRNFLEKNVLLDTISD